MVRTGYDQTCADYERRCEEGIEFPSEGNVVRMLVDAISLQKQVEGNR